MAVSGRDALELDQTEGERRDDAAHTARLAHA
jgi:hypothetical protein